VGLSLFKVGLSLVKVGLSLVKVGFSLFKVGLSLVKVGLSLPQTRTVAAVEQKGAAPPYANPRRPLSASRRRESRRCRHER
jgi:hypothetical protein